MTSAGPAPAGVIRNAPLAALRTFGSPVSRRNVCSPGAGLSVRAVMAQQAIIEILSENESYPLRSALRI
jgi:hypothetical protein